MALFPQKRQSFLSSVGFQQSLDINRAVYFWFKKRRPQLKKEKTVSKITGLFSLYEREADKLHGQE